ncbi:hypothetical protein [Flavobacterium terrisoli]|uniref:hypothetical protein n=1 Tax=Flavobacterium terrisoli TaxID=3242195 RepID=UPI0025432C3C|nr:hypothetical protein [Flavobacterium buctense]
MNASTVYDVFLALPQEEREKFIVLLDKHHKKVFIDVRMKKSKKVKFTKQDAIEYLLATVFKPKT